MAAAFEVRLDAAADAGQILCCPLYWHAIYLSHDRQGEREGQQVLDMIHLRLRVSVFETVLRDVCVHACIRLRIQFFNMVETISIACVTSILTPCFLLLVNLGTEENRRGR